MNTGHDNVHSGSILSEVAMEALVIMVDVLKYVDDLLSGTPAKLITKVIVDLLTIMVVSERSHLSAQHAKLT